MIRRNQINIAAAPAVSVAIGFILLVSLDSRRGDAALGQPGAIQEVKLHPDASGLAFIDVTTEAGLSPDVVGASIARCTLVDLNDDSYPDAVIDRRRVFLNVPNDDVAGSVEESSGAVNRRFIEIESPGLPEVFNGDCVVFADLDNDGHRDAIITRYVDKNNADWKDHGERTAWFPGHGDGTFGAAQIIEGLTPATTAAVAVGDVNCDGLLDLWIGNWYEQYGGGHDGYANELALQTRDGGWRIIALPHDDEALHLPLPDTGGRPTYGVMIAELVDLPGAPADERPELIELNYGRRANRLFVFNASEGNADGRWRDVAPFMGFDADGVRHGRYPEWSKERFKARDIELDDELPFRANGNTFDCSIADIDNDGDFDVFLAEVTHGWAGESSDRSRFLINGAAEARAALGKHETFFMYDPRRSVDRAPPGVDNWNQGDLFSALADFDHDGLIDLLLSSGDYPDNQRLRFYRQELDRTFTDRSNECGLDHDGSQQISVGDVNGDGALDVIAGQTFFRYTDEMKEGRAPQLRLFISRPPAMDAESLTLRLEGDPAAGVNRDALGAIVEARVGDQTMRRRLVGVGGHAGKQMDFLIHFGLGDAQAVDELTVIWPGGGDKTQRFSSIQAGRYSLRQGDDPIRIE